MPAVTSVSVCASVPLDVEAHRITTFGDSFVRFWNARQLARPAVIILVDGHRCRRRAPACHAKAPFRLYHGILPTFDPGRIHPCLPSSLFHIRVIRGRLAPHEIMIRLAGSSLPSDWRLLERGRRARWNAAPSSSHDGALIRTQQSLPFTQWRPPPLDGALCIRALYDSVRDGAPPPLRDGAFLLKVRGTHPPRDSALLLRERQYQLRRCSSSRDGALLGAQRNGVPPFSCARARTSCATMPSSSSATALTLLSTAVPSSSSSATALTLLSKAVPPLDDLHKALLPFAQR
ncbi:hypothetical protein GGX14DRAFT_561619 [Mycena pura]|uniref:Uncharacterized protein n=1 Tax=Mycena pura TaxID=153505 RepID=A0AAD6YH67_9AGAR|nr:hypothetical protein GGX14DRAFT_561619 [Mycena pura]